MQAVRVWAYFAVPGARALPPRRFSMGMGAG